jgi:hypothetical protein
METESLKTAQETSTIKDITYLIRIIAERARYAVSKCMYVKKDEKRNSN